MAESHWLICYLALVWAFFIDSTKLPNDFGLIADYSFIWAGLLRASFIDRTK
jgi:hypothetical protein